MRAYNFLHILQVILSIQILLDYPFTSSSCLELPVSLLHYLVDTEGGGDTGGEPGWSWTAAWRPHRGTPGGTLRGRPPQRLAQALLHRGPHAGAPNLRRGAGGWGNRLLVVTDDDEVAVTGQTCAPLKGGGRPKSRQSGIVCCLRAAWTT